jgi:glycosyltransferase involved in cell wall biosynthesis
MPAVAHVVTTANFAGVERHVAEVARETALRGWDVAVIGGDPRQMQHALGNSVQWRAGSHPVAALSSLARLGIQDICHAHMTLGEAVGVAARPFHHGAVVSTRHFAAPRGASRVGRMLAPWIAARLTREIAPSEFIAANLERRPNSVISNGVRASTVLWRSDSRIVLVLQRLEREKDTLTALRAWLASALAEDGWSLRIVGDGAERRLLEEWASSHQLRSVEFVGWSEAVEEQFADAAVLLAPAPAEPFGLSVVEAMAAGVPVVASAAGGHLETIGKVSGASLFPPGDFATAAAELRLLRSDDARKTASVAGRVFASRALTIEKHVDALLDEYRLARDQHDGVK